MLAHVPGVRHAILLFVILCGFAPAALANGWSIEHPVAFAAGDFQSVEQPGGWEIESPSGVFLGLSGAPRVPVEARTFVLPQGMRVSDAELRDAVWLELVEGTFLTEVEQFSSEGQLASREIDRFGFADSRSPARTGMASGNGTLEGYSLGSFELIPVRERVDGRIEYLASATIHLELEVDPRQRAVREIEWPGQREATQDQVREIVSNPADLVRYAPPTGREPSELVAHRPGDGMQRTLRAEPRRIDYLIITSTDLVPLYQTLADRREAEGLNSVVVSLDEVFATATPGSDQQETIRNYIRDAWSQWGVQYLMLAGDAASIPPRYARSTYYPAGSYSDVPSDLYYAALDGTWNADGNGLPGEPTDDVDVYAELSIARLPLETPAEVTAWLNKLLAYEEPVSTAFLGRALFLSEVLFPDDWKPGSGDPISLDGASYSEDLIFDQIIAGGNLMQSWRMYQNNTAYPGAIVETKAAAMDSMNSGHFGLVNHIGHGFYYNMSVGDDNIFAADANALVNQNPFFIHALNCSSGAFDVESLLERFIQNMNGGAVASAGSSRAAFPYWAAFYQTDFFDEIFVDKNTRIGDAVRAARATYSPLAVLEGGHRWTHFTYHLFGDPTMRMAVAEPLVANVTHAASVVLGTDQILVNVTAGGSTDGSVVAISDGAGRTSSAVVQPGGSALVDLAGLSNEPGTLNLVVTGPNVLRHQGVLDVLPGGAGHLRAEAVSMDDGPTAPSDGDGDGIAETGETIEWGFRFSNDGGGGPVAGATATLVAVDAPGVTILVDTAPLPSVADASFEDGPAFVVTLDPTIPDGTLLRFDVEMTAGGDTWIDPVELAVRSPILHVARLIVDDSGSGNGDGIVDAGEQFDLVVEVINRGEAEIQGLTATLVSVDPAVSILDGAGAWPDLPPDLLAQNNDSMTMIELDVATEHFSEIQFVDAWGHQWTHPFELRAPAAPADPVADTSLGPDLIALRMQASAEPHFAGYRAYRRLFGETQFEVLSDEPSRLTGLIVDEGLPELTRFEYRVTLVDSSAVESAPTAVVSASTAPGELSPGFPIPIGRELAGPLAVGDMRGDNSNVVAFGADWIYALDSTGQELLDGDGDAQTLGPLGGDPDNLRFEPSGVTMADLDNDGADEIISSNWDSREVWVLRADGSHFPGWPQLMNAKSWATPSVGDIDNDGDLEIVVNNTGGRTYVWNHDGSDFFDADLNPGTVGVFHTRTGENFNRSTPALYDVDGDGTLEIIFGTHYRNNVAENQIHALRNDGTDAPGWPKNTGFDGFCVGHVTIGDLDHDGTKELVLQTEDDSLRILQPDGSNFGSAPYHVRSRAAQKDSRAPATALADFDYDGDLEMVVVSILDRDECEVMIMEHDGSIWPGWPRTLPGLSESSPVLGDLDGDNLIDILFGIEGTDNILYAMSTDAGDLPGFPMTLAGAVRSVPVICDFDIDGDVDIVYAGFDRLVHVWDMPFPYREPLTPWPTFQANQHRTGVFASVVATAVLSADIELSALPNGVRVFASFEGALPKDFRFSLERTDAGANEWKPVASSLEASGNALIYVDESARAGARYEYRLTSAGGGVEFRSGVIAVPALRAALRAVEPNPFNPSTTIYFEVPGTAGALVPTRLDVFDVKGRLVRRIHSGPLTPGEHSLLWDGVDDRGQGVASGVYLAVLRCAGEQRSMKMSLVK